jgi:hypothetical protein
MTDAVERNNDIIADARQLIFMFVRALGMYALTDEEIHSFIAMLAQTTVAWAVGELANSNMLNHGHLGLPTLEQAQAAEVKISEYLRRQNAEKR